MMPENKCKMDMILLYCTSDKLSSNDLRDFQTAPIVLEVNSFFSSFLN